MATLDELFGEEENKRLEQTRLEIAKEKADWLAKTDKEKKEYLDKIEAKYEIEQENNEDEDYIEICSNCGEPDCDNDCDGEYD